MIDALGDRLSMQAKIWAVFGASCFSEKALANSLEFWGIENVFATGRGYMQSGLSLLKMNEFSERKSGENDEKSSGD